MFLAAARLVVFTPRAAVDVLAAMEWYDRRRVGLAARFLRNLDETIKAVRQYPEQAPVSHGSIRRASIRRFPYGVFYELEGDVVVVLAVMHARRGPKALP